MILIEPTNLSVIITSEAVGDFDAMWGMPNVLAL
jgi:hypothetical protein